MSRKIRIVLSGIYFPVAILRYFENALLRRDDVELITVGPFTGTHIPWAGGMNLPAKYAKSPDVPLPAVTASRPGTLSAEFVRNQIGGSVDLWIQVDAGWWFGDKPPAGVVAHVATDPHVLNYDRQRGLCDYFFNMQKVYSKPGDIYLPYAADPVVHAPLEGIEKEYDACLIGLQYENRTRLVEALRAKGLKVYYDIGPAYREYQLLYAKSRVALSWSSKEDLIARVFEGMMMKVPVVCNYVPDLTLHFRPGTHCWPFNDLDTAIAVVEAVRNSPPDLGDRAHDLVVEKHTYDHRVQQILETCGVL